MTRTGGAGFVLAAVVVLAWPAVASPYWESLAFLFFMYAALAVAGRAYLLELGEIRHGSEARAMLTDPELAAVYFGRRETGGDPRAAGIPAPGRGPQQ